MDRGRYRASKDDQGRSISTPQIELGQAVDAQDLRQLTAVVGVMGEEAHQDRLAGMELRLLTGPALELLEELVWCPPLEAAGDDLPTAFERLGQLDSGPGCIEVVLPTVPAQKISKRRRVGLRAPRGHRIANTRVPRPCARRSPRSANVGCRTNLQILGGRSRMTSTIRSL